MSGINLAAGVRSVGDQPAAVRALERQVAHLRSSRALSVRSVLAGLVAGADSIASAALSAAVLAQGRADEAWDLANARPQALGGTASGTTSAAGEFTVGHALGKVPVLAVAQATGAPDLLCAYMSATTLGATFVLVDRTTGVVASSPYSVTWSVIG